MTLMTLMTLMPLRGIQGHSVIQGHNYRLSNGCADRAKGPGQIEFVDCLHERCKRCCIVNYLNTHTSRAFALSPGKLLAHVLNLQKERVPRKDIVVHSVETES